MAIAHVNSNVVQRWYLPTKPSTQFFVIASYGKQCISLQQLRNRNLGGVLSETAFLEKTNASSGSAHGAPAFSHRSGVADFFGDVFRCLGPPSLRFCRSIPIRKRVIRPPAVKSAQTAICHNSILIDL